MIRQDYEHIIRQLIGHFAVSEGTDHLGAKGELVDVAGLSEEQAAELTRLRDEARSAIGWAGYDGAPD